MADEHNNEVLMQLVDGNGNTLAAECRTEVDTDDDDMVSDYFNGTFFQVDNFTFNMEIHDKDQATDAANVTGAHGVGAAKANKQQGPQGEFAKWKSAKPEDLKNMKFKLTMGEFQVTRRYDRASPILFEKCATSDSFNSASLVKRKVIGGDKLGGFLRFDFTDVLISNISWEDSDVIKETLKFVFRGLTVQYKTQKFSGKLNPAGSVPWTYDTKLLKAS